jgi:hypothetical protein
VKVQRLKKAYKALPANMRLRNLVYKRADSEANVIDLLLRFSELPRPWSGYISPEAWNIRHQAAKALRSYLGEENPEIGQVIEAWRATNRKEEFADLKAGKELHSIDHSSGKREKGLSVATGLHYAARGYRYVYRIKGTVVGFGVDGEPLLKDCTPVGRLMSSDAAVNWDWTKGPSAKRDRLIRQLSAKVPLTREELIRLSNEFGR